MSAILGQTTSLLPSLSAVLIGVYTAPGAMAGVERNRPVTIWCRRRAVDSASLVTKSKWRSLTSPFSSVYRYNQHRESGLRSILALFAHLSVGMLGAILHSPTRARAQRGLLRWSRFAGDGNFADWKSKQNLWFPFVCKKDGRIVKLSDYFCRTDPEN